MSDDNTKLAETSEEISSSAPSLPTRAPILAPLHDCKASGYMFWVTLPPKQQGFISDIDIILHLGQIPELRDALEATYGAESEMSLPTFLKKWRGCSLHLWLYRSPDEHKRSAKLQCEMMYLVNEEASVLGCALLTSIFPAFWDSLNMARGEQTPEAQAVVTFSSLLHSLKPSRPSAWIPKNCGERRADACRLLAGDAWNVGHCVCNGC